MRQRQSEIDVACPPVYCEFGCVAPGLAVASLVDPRLLRGYPEGAGSLGISQHERHSTRGELLVPRPTWRGLAPDFHTCPSVNRSRWH